LSGIDHRFPTVGGGDVATDSNCFSACFFDLLDDLICARGFLSVVDDYPSAAMSQSLGSGGTYTA
jgi:hypothetical protein